MQPKYERGVFSHFHEIEAAKTHWGWFLGLGILMALLGLVAISASVFVTLFSVVLAGFALLVAGIVQIVHGVSAREWKGVFLSLLLGILYSVTGLVCLSNPAASAISLTLLIGAFCLTVGLFRIIVSLFLRFLQWEWVFFNGIVTFILGLAIITQWPASGLWIIGLFIGVDILLAGLSLIVLSLSVRRY